MVVGLPIGGGERCHEVAQGGRIARRRDWIENHRLIGFVQSRKLGLRCAQTSLGFEKLCLAIIAVQDATLVEIQATLEQIARFCDRPLELPVIRFAIVGQWPAAGSVDGGLR